MRVELAWLSEREIITEIEKFHKMIRATVHIWHFSRSHTSWMWNVRNWKINFQIKSKRMNSRGKKGWGKYNFFMGNICGSSWMRKRWNIFEIFHILTPYEGIVFIKSWESDENLLLHIAKKSLVLHFYIFIPSQLAHGSNCPLYFSMNYLRIFFPFFFLFSSLFFSQEQVRKEINLCNFAPFVTTNPLYLHTSFCLVTIFWK